MRRVSIFHMITDAMMVCSLAAIVVSMILQVLARYMNHAALPWPEELSQLLLVVFSFLGMYRAIGEDAHIRLDLLPAGNSSKLVRGVKAVGLLAACGFVLYIGYGGALLAENAWSQPSTAMRLPMGIFYLVIPVTCFLSFLAIARKIRVLLKGDGDHGDGEGRNEVTR